MKIRTLTLILLMLALVGGSSPVPAQAETLIYYWLPCNTGTPAIDYMMEVEIDNVVVDSFLIGNASLVDAGDPPAPHVSHGYYAAHGNTIRVRVAGLDDDLRQGVWSLWSVEYTVDDGAPGWGTTCIPWR